MLIVSKERSMGIIKPVGLYRPYSGAAAGPPPFNPSSIMTSLFLADAQIYDGSNLIGTWTDSLGVANATQSTGAKKPTYVAAALNGKGVLRNTTSTYMDFGSANNFALGQSFSCFAVAKINTQGGTWYSTLFSFKGAEANRSFSVVACNDASYGNLWCCYIGNGTNVPVVSAASASATGSYLLFTITFNGGTVSSTSSYVIGINGSSQTLSNPGGTGIGPGNANYLCSWSTGTPASFALVGDVAEWGFNVGTAWSASDISNLWTYYQSKFSL